MANRWVDEAWWRDWIVWVAAVVAASTVVVGLARQVDSWWWVLWRAGFSLVATVALLGFVRTVVRTYRA